MGSPDDDFSSGMGNSDVASGVAFLCKLTGEELAKFCTEDTIGDKLVFLACIFP